MSDFDDDGWDASVGVYAFSEAQWSLPPSTPVNSDEVVSATRYQRTSLLGEGGMGQVWLGWDAQLQRNVAIKCPRQDMPPKQVQLLTREAMITAKLEHPGIVSIHDVYQDNDLPHYVMELIRGQSLRALVDDHHQHNKTLSTSLVRQFMVTCEAMGYAHQMGIVHRDLSPMNILVTPTGQTHIIDWGLAVFMDDLATHQGKVGTPGFIAPEQRDGTTLGPRSDVWSLGALLCLILYNEPPSPALLSSVQRVNAPLHAIMDCALSDDPQARYADASAMAQDLLRWFEGQRVEAHEMNAWEMLQRLVRMYKKRLMISGVIVLAFGFVVVAGVMAKRQEAERARLAEKLAKQRQKQADKEALNARKASARILHDGAVQFASAQNIKEATRLASLSLKTHDNPDARGLLSSLAVFSIPTTKTLYQLPECVKGKWSLTNEPDMTLCHGVFADFKRLKAWRKGKWIWHWPVKAKPDHPCAIKRMAVFGRELIADMIRHGQCETPYIVLDLFSGHLKHVRPSHGDLLLSDHQLRVDSDKQFVEGYARSRGVCTHQIINGARSPDQRVWLICDDYSVWRQRHRKPDAAFERVDVSTDAQTHALVFDPQTGHAWMTSNKGVLFSTGQKHRSWSFGESVKKMAFLPKSSLLVILGSSGKLRVFDTNALAWRWTMPDRYSDIAVDSGMRLRALDRGGQVVQWTFARAPKIARYHGKAGFAIAAWSRDQTKILGADGEGFAHLFAPFEGKTWPAVKWNRGVSKWVTADPKTNDFYLTGILSQGVQRSSLVNDVFDVVTHPQYKQDKTLRKRMMMAPDGRILSLHYGPHFTIEAPNTFKRQRQSFAETPIDADASADHGQVAIIGPTRLFLWDWHTKPRILKYGKDAHAVSINTSGEVLIASKDKVVLYNAKFERQRQWSVDWSMILDVEWVPQSHHAVLGHLDGTMSLWDTRTGELIARGKQHTERVIKVDITRDGRWLVTASWDGTLVVWDLDVARKH